MAENDIWAGLDPCWVLSDTDLRSLVTNGEIVTADAAVVETRESCIELKVGHTVHFPFRPPGQNKSTLEKTSSITIQPGEVISVVTEEKVGLPLDGYGRIYPKGRMTTIGLAIASTNVDPGFQGCLIISIINASRAPIKLKRGTAIAKLELSKLATKNIKGYSGSHGSGHESLPFDPYLFAGEYRERAEEIARKSHWMAALSVTLAFGAVACILLYPLRDVLINIWEQSPGEILSVAVPAVLAGLLALSRKVYVRLSLRELREGLET